MNLSIKKGLMIGIIASLITFIGDMLLGYIQVENTEKSLMNFSLALPVSRIVWGGFLGVVGIPLQCIGYQQIYKLMKENSKQLASLYKIGIWGWIALAACGVHLNCAVVMFIYKQIYSSDMALAHTVATEFANNFLIPCYYIFILFFLLMNISQLFAFCRKQTIYPKKAALYNMLIGIIVIQIIVLILPDSAVRNGIKTAAISLGNILMFTGLLITYPKKI